MRLDGPHLGAAHGVSGGHQPLTPCAAPSNHRDLWTRWAVLVWTIVLLVVCINSAVNPRIRSLYLTWLTAGKDWASGSPMLYQHQEGDGLDIFRYSPLVAALLTPLRYLD